MGKLSTEMANKRIMREKGNARVASNFIHSLETMNAVVTRRTGQSNDIQTLHEHWETVVRC